MNILAGRMSTESPGWSRNRQPAREGSEVQGIKGFNVLGSSWRTLPEYRLDALTQWWIKTCLLLILRH
jgi:hypothetical protein